ncbi:methyl-accepting chemotaxis protein [Alkalibacillus flavidus]|uniref:Methyl-accepting chemotaxis protein n=1 Tax=Alkalibacillus flavidus TaxID=546021 RepID=A0ABV2KUB1_9BACI
MKKLRLKNMNIGWKYGSALIIVFLLFGIATAAVAWQVQGIGQDVDALERRGDRAINIQKMGSLTRSQGIRIEAYAREENDEFVTEYEDRASQFNDIANGMEARLDTEKQQNLFTQIMDNKQQMDQLFNELVNASSNAQQVSVANEAGEVRSTTIDLISQLETTVNEDRQEAIADAKQSQTTTMIVLIAAIVVAIVIGAVIVIAISRVVKTNLTKVVDVSNQVAQNNLAVEKIDYDGNDEIGQMAEATNAMVDNLKEMVGRISEISETVSSQSEELNQSSNEVKEGAEQISSTMEELSSGAESQANNASDLSKNMTQFDQQVQESNESGQMIHESSKEVLELTGDGQDMMTQSVQQMATVDQIVKDAVEKVDSLDQQSQQISKLVSVIQDIAEQTNLLALNAAIEAARAGEHGQGFAVVADEVRKLAEQVSNSVGEITGIVDSIQNESSNVVNSLQSGYSEVEKGTEQIKTTGETFDQISGAVGEMSNQIQQVTENLSDIASKTQEMNSSVQEIASVSEESAAGIQQTSSSAEESAATMEEVAASSDQLAQLAEDLNGLVREFKLK